MADHSRSPKTDFYSTLGITATSSIKEICKAYKSLVLKWSTPDKNPFNQKEAQEKFTAINEAYDKAIKGKRFDEDDELTISEPTTIGFDHHKSVDDSFFSRSNSFLSRNATSRRCKTPTPNFSRDMNHRRSALEEKEFSNPFPRNMSRRRTPETHIHTAFLSRNKSTQSTTPIVFSQSTAKKKPAPVERKLECALEELLDGCVKKIKITRDVIAETGVIVQEEEVLWITVKPGWRRGTKIMFEGKGDEKPGYLPADIILLIDEKRHPLYEREGDDLEIVVEIPLVKALTGCSIPIPLLGGDNMTLSFDDIIYPGYEKVIRGQGMPNPKEQSRRGDLRIKFLVEFPAELSDEQRAEAVDILQDCS
ncbi:DnaJ homolog subfamily B member 13 [Morus notabilis]|uniref:DnaJ homolog subfamily B member 13 n=1 Tax=Morus notabilis TaxID=981085 RepID=W9SBK3_9ROSA|nr:DnaJ homolog subfamily B member 13 [Morus notabilis]